ncbi:MAG: hypothetical protein FXF47_02910 [Candidatus Mcinerneyibacterium aminivorans]|uniref:Uncharacterized protein n=1 Tax=Candidatus Mcinerneyibacterium aminivorans TaxID=2703815 RepID=A0A5D0MJE4_9BACT|nr:MAG: hypothetical protein FXF47_02910 [Candidatus Mcinerneyibacterium aminivorans]
MPFKPVIFNERDCRLEKNLKNKERRKKMTNMQIDIDKTIKINKGDLTVPVIKKSVQVEVLNLSKQEEYEMRFFKLFKGIYRFFEKNLENGEKELKKYEKFRKKHKNYFSESSSIVHRELE